MKLSTLFRRWFLPKEVPKTHQLFTIPSKEEFANMHVSIGMLKQQLATRFPSTREMLLATISVKVTTSSALMECIKVVCMAIDNKTPITYPPFSSESYHTVDLDSYFASINDITDVLLFLDSCGNFLQCYQSATVISTYPESYIWRKLHWLFQDIQSVVSRLREMEKHHERKH